MQDKNKKRKELLSVIIPAKNNHNYLEGLLKAVFNQKFSCQVIVVDDGSSPSLLSILKKFPKVEVIRNEKSKGPAAARNQGLRLVKGDYITFLDSDDYWKPGFAKTMVAACRDSEGAVLCFSSKVFSKNFELKQKINFWILTTFQKALLLYMVVLNRKTLLPGGFYLAQVSHMVFSKKLIKGLVFDESYWFGEDWEFIIKIQKKVKIKIIPRKLIYFRYHSKSISYKNDKKWSFYRRLFKELPPSIRKGILAGFFKLYIGIFSKPN